MKCDELETEQWLDYGGEPMPCYPAKDVDEAIAELKAENDRLKEALHRLSCNADCCYRVQFKSTKRDLWLARANYCHNFRVDWYLSRHPHSKMSQSVMENTLIMAEMNCRKKAREYE
jgi:hypothetical protein